MDFRYVLNMIIYQEERDLAEKTQHRSIITPDLIGMDMELLLNVLDNVQNAILIIDQNETIVYINREYTTRLGISPKKVLGKSLREIEPKALALKVLKTREPICDVVEYVESLKINAIGVTLPLYNKQGDFWGVTSMFNNVTELIRISEDLKRTKEMTDYLQEQLRDEQLPQSFQEYVCVNNEHKKTLQLAARVAPTDSTVLILGESGVGKEVMAKTIHNASKRSTNPLIKVNCASIPENLLESELFGYEEGAFTGARKGGKMGKFELANNGTIFLDEIGDMSFNMQAKLLRVLQERELERVGGTRSIPLNIRVITATNRDLKAMIDAGTFRGDLYYRLNVISLTIPSLRERREDIMPLVRVFLRRMAPGEKVTVSPSVMKILQEYDWPGNVRELQNVLEYASVVRTSETIVIKDLPQYLKPKLPIDETGDSGRFNIKTATALLERDYMIEAIKACQGNKSLAIRELGISRRAFYEKLEKYGLVNLAE